jgi:hypothetical protein
MMRQGFILMVLAAVVAVLLWDFMTQAVLYDPLDRIQAVEKVSTDRSMSMADFQAAWGADIHEKNLFSPQRGAPPPAPEPAELTPVPMEDILPPPVRPDFSLSGIIRNDFGELIAYVKVGQTDPVPVRQGDSIEDAEVVEVTDRTVRLTWNGENIDLSLTHIEELTR